MKKYYSQMEISHASQVLANDSQILVLFSYLFTTVSSVEKNEINYSSDFTHENQYFAFVLDSECKINTRGFNQNLI